MNALLGSNPGGPETLLLEDIAEPIPGAKEVRVAVRACGVNYPDLGSALTDRFKAACGSGGAQLSFLRGQTRRGDNEVRQFRLRS